MQKNEDLGKSFLVNIHVNLQDLFMKKYHKVYQTTNKKMLGIIQQSLKGP